MKPQAARFRLFGYDVAGNLVQEITQADGAISWTVELANIKASGQQFGGASLRNLGAADRASLEITPGPRTLDGPNQEAGFNTGHFLGAEVPLGGDAHRCRRPPAGPGRFRAVHVRRQRRNGPVTAQVLLNGAAAPLVATPAWVICGPPDFAPAVATSLTLWDALFDRMTKPGHPFPSPAVPAQPSFTTRGADGRQAISRPCRPRFQPFGLGKWPGWAMECQPRRFVP